MIPKRSAGVSAIYTYVQSPGPSLPWAGCPGFVSLVSSWSDRAGSPDPSRVLSCSSFLQSWSQQGEIQQEARAGDGRQAEKGRDVSGPRAAACFSDLGLGRGHGWGLQCPFAVALPVISLCAAWGRDWGRGAGCRLPLSSLESACSQRELKRPREQSTSCVSGLCRGHKHCRTPPVPPSHSPGGCGRPLALNPASFWHKFGERMLSVFPAKKSRAALVLVSGAVAMPKAGCRSAGSLSLPVGAGAGWKAAGRTAHRGARSRDLSQ